jgi:5-methylthioadenosine/S-adenosylhomocysteine deaminase
VLLGRLATFDPNRPEVEDGALYIGGDELIHAVQRRTDPAPPGFDSARRVRTGGAIYPGLIDLHNHMVYNVLPPWSPPGQTEPFSSRYQWPRHRHAGGRDSATARPRNRRYAGASSGQLSGARR